MNPKTDGSLPALAVLAREGFSGNGITHRRLRLHSIGTKRNLRLGHSGLRCRWVPGQKGEMRKKMKKRMNSSDNDEDDRTLRK